jgi:hypothetical protein
MDAFLLFIFGNAGCTVSDTNENRHLNYGPCDSYLINFFFPITCPSCLSRATAVILKCVQKLVPINHQARDHTIHHVFALEAQLSLIKTTKYALL